MKVLIIGGGGREHALAWKIAQSPLVDAVMVAPGNAGTAREDKVHNVPIAAENVAELVEFARAQAIDLTIVGPETPLVLGIVDQFSAAGLKCFGPTQTAAQLEGSKSFAKDFLARHRIPTAAYRNFTDPTAAADYIRAQGAPIVVKADGLAAGKGVILASTEAEAIRAVDDMLAGNAFGAAGHRVVIEELLRGEEASFIVMVDGEHILPMASSQDHKARDDGDLGPNTGGMGAYSPAPVVTPDMHQRILREVIEPTVTGLRADGIRYTGFLYAGIMITPDGSPKVLEFNCRFGDPETQPIMMRLKSDLVELVLAALAGQLDQVEAEWDTRAAVGVVLAAGGYPSAYRQGDPIHWLDALDPTQAKLFHAGTRDHDDGTIITQGGRVLCAVGLGDSVTAAQQTAYAAARSVRWEGMFYRHDIGYRAIARERDNAS
ncbi:MAG: phosphoribosylamine--glycine ligase [Thiotrichales bacterium]